MRLVIALLLFTAANAHALECAKVPNPSKDSKQLIVVTTADFNDKYATLTRFERSSTSGAWVQVGEPIDALIGKNGFGWGKDFQSLATPSEATVKTEGDGKSPAGVFAIGKTFGFNDPASLKAPRKQNYIQLKQKQDCYCIDDLDSKEYNHLDCKPSAKTIADSASGLHNENMAAQPLYEVGAFIDYKSDRKLKTGSCIFMHIWKASDHGTTGCVAMEKPNIQAIDDWMNKDDKPSIAMLTKNTYRDLAQCLKLPTLPDTSAKTSTGSATSAPTTAQ